MALDKERLRRTGDARPGPTFFGMRFGGGGESAHKRRIVVSLGLLLVLGWIYLDQREEASDPASRVELPLLAEPAQREPLARVHRELLARVRDETQAQRAYLEPEASLHLLDQAARLVPGDLVALGLSEVPRAELLADSASRRGDAVAVTGRLLWWDGAPSARGEIVDSEGDSWTFLSVLPPTDIAPSDVVRLEGFYFKHHAMLRADATFAEGPLLVVEEPLRSAFRMPPVTELPADVLDRVRDEEPREAAADVDGPELYALLSYVANTPYDLLVPPEARRVDRTPLEVIRRRGELRGRPVRVFGQVLAVQERLLGPGGVNPLGIPRAFTVWLSNLNGGVAECHLLEEPAGVRMGQLLYVDGLFLRRHAYESRAGDLEYSAVLAAKHFEPHVVPPDATRPLVDRILLVIFGLVVVAIVAGVWMQRR